MNKFIKLKKDLINYKTGQVYKWHGYRDKYCPVIENEDGEYTLDMRNSLRKEEITDEWFEEAEPLEMAPPRFPDQKFIERYIKLYPEYLIDCEETESMKKVFDNDRFKKELYDFYKDKYDNDMKKDEAQKIVEEDKKREPRNALKKSTRTGILLTK